MWLGVIWTAPNTLLGLVLGCVGMLGGARVSLRARDWMVAFDNWPASWSPRTGALTLGNCVLHTGLTLDSPCGVYAPVENCSPGLVPEFADHERAHVLQYMVLGPLFLPVYFALGGISARNPLERAADRYALTGHGWWPWGAHSR